MQMGRETYPFSLPLIGSYNVANALARRGRCVGARHPRLMSSSSACATRPRCRAASERFVSADWESPPWSITRTPTMRCAKP